MEQDFSLREAEHRGRQSRLRLILAVSAVAFLVGVAATFYAARNFELPQGPLFRLQQEPVEAEPAPEPTETPEPALLSPVAQDVARVAAERVERVAEQQGGLDQRVAAMEQRIARLDLQSRAAMGNAARAEGLLIAFATRRAIERGAPLGYLADQLRLRFGDARPNSVQAVIEAAADPVTLDQLLARLDALGPVLSSAPQDEGFMARVSRELSQVFVVRRETDPSPAAQNRLDRARLFLESGRAEAAITEVRRLPNAAEAAIWIADAERYAAVQRALELLETTAILEPRELRDGTGERVEQPSPAGAGGQ